MHILRSLLRGVSFGAVRGCGMRARAPRPRRGGARRALHMDAARRHGLARAWTLSRGANDGDSSEYCDQLQHLLGDRAPTYPRALGLAGLLPRAPTFRYSGLSEFVMSYHIVTYRDIALLPAAAAASVAWPKVAC